MGKATKVRKKKPEAGRAILDEDRGYVTGRMSLKAPDRAVRPPPVTEIEHVTLLDVEERLLRAMQTLRAMPDRDRRFFAIKSGHPEHVQDQIDAYAAVEAIAPTFKPTPADVSDYLRALSWARCLDRNAWKLVWWRSFELSFGLIAKYIGRSDETARRRYKEAIVDVWAAANGAGTSRAA